MTLDNRQNAATTSIASRTGLQWPSRPHWIAFAIYLLLIQLLWFAVYGGADWITSHHSHRVRLHLEGELAIPFVPGAALVYLSLLPMLWLSPLLLHSADQLRSFAKSLAVLICISGVGFVLLPSQPAYAQVSPSGPFAALFRFMDAINLSHNMCPSLHVGMATLAAYTYSRVLDRWPAVWVGGWALAIALSTLITHQHHVVDVLVGGVLGYLVAVHMHVGLSIV